MRRIVAAFLMAAAVASPTSAQVGDPKAGEKPVWLAVTRPMFVEAVKPLAERRANEGFETVVSTEPPGKALAALKRRPAFVVIVGDDRPNSAEQPWFVGARRMNLYRWEKTQAVTFASDMAWGDLDGDGVVDVPVSRLPVRTADELKRMIGKIAAWEDRAPSADDLAMSVWAGSPNYGPAVESLATMLLMNTLRSSAPPWCQAWAIVCDPQSPLCGWPDDQPGLFERQVRKSGGFDFMIGHGSIGHFEGMAGGGYRSDAADRAFTEGPPAAPLLVMACGCGDFSAEERCLTRAMVLAPGGPVAAIGATTDSHPLTNYFSGQSFLKTLDASGERRLGALWLASERRAAKARAPLVELTLRDVEGSLEDPIDLVKLRRDQTLMYAILGDGATRLRQIEPLTVRLERAGNAWRWTATKPADATELVVGLRTLDPLPVVPEGNPDRDLARKNFDAANASFVFGPAAKLPAGADWAGAIAKEGTLRLVAIAPGKLYVAVRNLRKPPPEPPPGGP